MFDGKEFGETLVTLVKDYVARELAPLRQRLDEADTAVRQLEDVVTSAKAIAYRGVHKLGEAYDQGDLVTFGGSLWHCNSLTKTRPGEGAAEWTLAVKRGRDGKDAR